MGIVSKLENFVDYFASTCEVFLLKVYYIIEKPFILAEDLLDKLNDFLDGDDE